MADKLLICISAEQATVSVSHNGKLGACQAFANDDEGAESFDRYVASLKSMPALVMVDAVEEDLLSLRHEKSLLSGQAA